MMDQERWYQFSFSEQMAHIGSEISRARIWEEKDQAVSRERCLERALELIDLTKNDKRLYKRRKELCYLREVIADQYCHAGVYETKLSDLDKYCLEFALIVRKDH